MDGRKPLALLIPGLDGTGRFFEPHIPALEKRYRVLAWWFHPRPGFGFSDLVAELAEGTADEDPSSITVVGESFGGPVALHFVLAHQDRVSRLLLINSFAVYRRRARVRLACRLCPLLRVAGFRQVKDFLAERLLRFEGVPEEGIRHYREVIRLVRLPEYRRRLELVRDLELQERLPEIRVPTLILASGRDRIVPSVREGREMASRIPGAELHEFPRAGHALLLTPGFSLASYV